MVSDPYDAEAEAATYEFAREIMEQYGHGAVDWCLEKAAEYCDLQNHLFEAKMIELVGIISREQSPRFN